MKQADVCSSCPGHVHPAVPDLGLPHCFCVDDGMRQIINERNLRCCWCGDWAVFREVKAQSPGHGPHAMVTMLEMKVPEQKSAKGE